MNEKTGDNSFQSMSLGDHLDELRTRLILAIVGLVVGMVICLCFGKMFMALIAKPYESAMVKAQLEPVLIAIRPPEKFLVYLKVSLLFGLLLSSPWVFYQLWAFISAGLYTREKKYIHLIAPTSAVLFVLGGIFFITVVAPITMLFFIKFDPGIGFVKVNFTLQNYVTFAVSLTIVFGLAFQLPIAVLCAEKLGIVSIRTLNRSRKYVILLLVIIAAIATPPDVISQIALAVPLYALFEASILICLLTRRKKISD